MIRELILVALAACAAYAQTKPVKELQFWFNGSGLTIHTESSAANSPLSTTGSISVVDGHPAHRIVVDGRSRPLFAYDIDLVKAPRGGVLLSIRPLDPAKLRSESWGPKVEIPSDIPTLNAARDFPALQIGDAVQVDIMINPATGEKLWDVLRVLGDPPPPFQQTRPSPGKRFSFERVKVAIDGKVISEPRNTWMIGKAILMRVPGHGEYYMVLSPTPDLPFQASGWVDHQVLRFSAANEQVEITGVSNLLQSSEYGTVWVYHVPESRVRSKTTSVDFTCADNIGQLLRQ